MRRRSYTPSPPRGYGRRGRSPSPRGRYGGGGRSSGRDMPTSLLVRNLRRDCRPEDLRRPFGQFGPLKDIYLPKDYYTGLSKVLKTTFKDPRGFGFVQFVDPNDAAEAKYQMDGQTLLGRELTVVFAEENRKKPGDMRARDGGSRGRFNDRRRSPPRYSRSPKSSSPPPRLARSRDYSPPPRRHYSRSISPQDRKYSQERSYRERSYSQSPPYNGSRSRSQSPIRDQRRSRSRSATPNQSKSPNRQEYSKDPNGERSPSQ